MQQISKSPLWGDLEGLPTIHNVGNGTWGNYSYTFTYDDMNRLTDANSANTIFNSVYTYDGDGHMTSSAINNVSSVTPRISNSHRISSYAGNTINYDNKGNVTYDGLGRWTTNEFNRNNLPLSMTSDTMSYTFRYNEKGERTNKNFSNGSHEKNEYYLLDYLGRTLAVYEGGRIKEGIINGNDVIGEIEISDESDKRYYYLKDHLGSVRSVLESPSSTVISAIDYGSYGETLRQMNDSVEVRYDYTGKEKDEAAGDRYFGARYLGTLPFWKSVDPLSEKYPGISPYTYVLGNPMNLIDPKGTEVEWTKDDLFNWLADGNDGFPVRNTNQNNGGTNNNNKDYYNRTNDGSVTLQQFINRFSGMTYKQIVKGKSKFLWIKYPNDMSDRRFRFMIDPLTNQEIDMIHFFVVGNLGHFMGIGNEVQQAFRFSGSAFWPQDIHSNILGVQFFERYGKAIESNPTKIINYLNEFFNDKSRLQIREYPDSINPF